MQDNYEKYESMDAEDRIYEAQSKIKRMIFMRVLVAALLMWVVIWFELPIAMVLLLIGVIAVILATMLPAIRVLKTDLKDPED